MQGFFQDQIFLEGDYHLHEIQIVQEIGKGNAFVFTGFVRGQIKAIKQIQIQNDFQYRSFLKEISLMEDLSNSTTCVIRYDGYLVTQIQFNPYSKKKYAYIVMECAQMNLNELIQSHYSVKKVISQQEIETILEFLLRSFSQLEKKNIAHCDIKPQNVLITHMDKLQLKICDVGSCKVLNAQSVEQATILGTIPFLAPQIIKAKTKKLISGNPFKSDVFSFGLVVLYIITGKKFTSKLRSQIEETAYSEIINEWVNEAIQLTNQDIKIQQVLRNALLIDQYQRPLFKQLRIAFESFKRKLKLVQQTKIRKLSLEEENMAEMINKFNQKMSEQELDSVRTTANNLKKIKFNKLNRLHTKINSGSSLNKNRYNSKNSPHSPNKSNTSFISSSPQKIQSNFSPYSKTIHVLPENKQIIPYDMFNHEDKIFVLHTNSVHFKKADTVSVFQRCSLSVLYPLSEITGNKFFLQYKGVKKGQLKEDLPILDFKQVSINLQESKLTGYNQLLRCLCPILIEKLRLKLTNSQISFKEVTNLLQRLRIRQIKELSLVWENTELSPKYHSEMFEKISKLPLKKLVLSFNECFLHYESPKRWLLPKTCEILYLEYRHNYMGEVIENLCNSLATLPLKWLYLNFQNNNLEKTHINLIFRTISQMQSLEKAIVNLSMNPIHDIQYLSQVLTKGKRIKYMEIRLHKCNISSDKFYHFISSISELFEEGQQVLKLTFDRKTRKQELLDEVQECLKEIKRIKVDVIGYNAEYFFINIKKEAKIKATNTNLIRIRKDNHLVIKTQKIKKYQPKSKQTLCHYHYSNYESYESYLCLECCEKRQLSKYQYYCKYCIENCEHKGHSIVRMFEKRGCSCIFSGKCRVGIPAVCAQTLNIKSKKQYRCQKCRKRYCEYCVRECEKVHKNWIQCCSRIQFNCGSTF